MSEEMEVLGVNQPTEGREAACLYETHQVYTKMSSASVKEGAPPQLTKAPPLLPVRIAYAVKRVVSFDNFALFTILLIQLFFGSGLLFIYRMVTYCTSMFGIQLVL